MREVADICFEGGVVLISMRRGKAEAATGALMPRHSTPLRSIEFAFS